MLKQPFIPVESHARAGHRLTQDFLQLVQKHAATHHDLGFYADLLGVTSGHLSDTTKEILGESAGRLIRQQIVEEAQKMLTTSEQTVAQIGERLNFNDASYFGRFFKRETQQTPNQFRLNRR